MDLEQLKYLTPDQKERYVALERTFDSEGWKVIRAWAATQSSLAMERAAFASNWEDHRIATGVRLSFDQIVNLRDATEAEYVSIAEDAMLSDEETDELEHE